MKIQALGSKLLQPTKCPLLKVLNNAQTANMVRELQILYPFHFNNNQDGQEDSVKHTGQENSMKNSNKSSHHVQGKVVNSDYASIMKQNIKTIKDEGRYREFKSLLKQNGNFPHAFQFNEVDENETLSKNIDVKNSKDIILWCSNDYLGMGQNKYVIEAAKNAINLCGVGAGGTRNIGGTSVYHVGLEKELANLHQKEAALLMSSGYVANQAGLSAIKQVLGDLIFLSDEKNHASLIDGMRSARGDKVIWKHNDLADLEEQLQKIDIDRPKLIIFESVYSMNGSVAPIKEICALAKKYNALTFLDEVHAVGLYGPEGAGIASRDECQDDVDFISGTMGKGFGCTGGYIVGTAVGIDCIRSNASNFIFTTALPPFIAAAGQASVRFLRENQDVRDRLHYNVSSIKQKLEEARIPVITNPSHIIPVIVGDAVMCKLASEMLLNEFGVYIQPINYPTVARGSEILRISATPNHTPEMIDHLVQSLVKTFDKLGIKKLSPIEVQYDQLNVEVATS